MPSHSSYRPDIDGLRAIAVICVVLFHLKLSTFSGGFVGVDVFFVISGFLISRIIVDEVAATKGFSFSNFYVRRARRILPALFFTIGLSAIFAFLLFSPEHFERFGASMLYAAASLANVLFWRESGYFDTDAATKPLLHTWSLSVEEQFYAAWPLFLVLLLKWSPRATIIGITVAGIASFGLNGWFLGDLVPLPGRGDWTPAAVFFLTPFRVFEFAIGSLVVWAVKFQPRDTVVLELALLVGLTMIGYAVFSYSDETVFPYLNALAPCLGTALAIYAGTAPISGLLLRNPITVGIGLISYSVYLLHWPLIVFYSYYKFSPLTDAEKFWLCALTLIGAVLMYRFVELPFRVRRGRKSFWTTVGVAAGSIAAALVLMAFGASIWLNDGWQWRLPEDRVIQSSWRKSRTGCRDTNPSMPKDLFPCQNYRNAANDIIIWGDSHALHLISGISEAYPNYNVYALFMVACVPQSGFEGFVREYRDGYAQKQCIEHNEKALEFLKTYRPSYVILSNAKRAKPATIAKPTLYILDELRKSGHQAFVLGDFIRPGRDIMTCLNVPDWLLPKEALASRCVADPWVAKSELDYNHALAGLIQNFVDPAEVQCPAGACTYVADGLALFRDTHHLAPYGSVRFLKQLRDKMPVRQLHAGSADLPVSPFER